MPRETPAPIPGDPLPTNPQPPSALPAMITPLNDYDVERTGSPAAYSYTIRVWKALDGWQTIATKPTLLTALAVVLGDAIAADLAAENPLDADVWAESRYYDLFTGLGNGDLAVRFRS